MTSTSIHSNEQVSRSRVSFSQGGVESSSKTTTSKLRDSCHACALSKVKCHKQKPSCSRCTKRGVACEYIVTKRPGRKRDSTHINSNNDGNGDKTEAVRQISPVTQHPWLSLTNSTNTNSMLSGSANFLSPSNLNITSPKLDNIPSVDHSTPDILDSLLMPLEHYPAELMGMGDEFDEFFNSPVNFSGSDTSENQFLGQGRNDIAKLLIPNDTGLEPHSGKFSGELSNTAKTTSPNIWSLSSSDTGESRASDSCSCLIQALDIMKKILANENMNSLQRSSGEHATKISKGLDIPLVVPSAQNVVSENKQTIEALTPMLQCSCGEDGYLLMVLSMIVFRILGRYAAAALQPPIEDGEKSDRSSMSISTKEYKKRVNNIDTDGEESRRMAAQLILRELHRVLRLINELSLRLQAHGRGSTRNSNEGFSVEKIFGWESKTPTLSDHLTKAAPFSAARFAQLEVDMRKCLNTLSSEIINMLQQI